MTYGMHRWGWQPTETRFHKGDRVVVKSGRKLRIGLVGRVFWAGWKNYSGNWVERVGLVELGDASEMALWTSAYNLRKATPEEAVPTVKITPKTDLVTLAMSIEEGFDAMETESGQFTKDVEEVAP